MTRDDVTVGIISYFPDDPNIKIARVNRLNYLIKAIDILFNVPITIIAQNWKGVSIREGTTRKPLTIYNYKEGLGINRAREVLREKFLDSDYEYLIMLDDDSQLRGTIEGGTAYLNQIFAHPDGYGVFKPSLLKLFAISKTMFKKIEYPKGGADDPDPKMRFFEDMYLVNTLQLLYPNQGFQFRFENLMEYSDSAFDEFSTGWHEVYKDTSEYKWDRHDTGDQTRFMIKQANRGNLLKPETLQRGGRVDINSFTQWRQRKIEQNKLRYK